MLVRKTLSVSEVQLKADGKGGFEGYAARFGGTDTYGDTLMKGAFDYSLRKYGKPKMFFNHEWTMPIGKFTKAAEDDSGLYVAGEFTPDLQRAAEVRACMQHGTIDGLSIGGFVKASDMSDKEDGSGKLISRFTRLVETSPVVFPADAGARVDFATVRGEDISETIEGLESVRDIERLLRDAGGFSKGLAQALVARFTAILSEGEPRTKKADAEARALEERIARMTSRLAA